MSARHDALMMDFPDEKSARLAAETFDELGYEPAMHEGGRLHIHVRNEDLTSALEIMQSFGGKLAEQAPAEITALTDQAYGLNAIPIPAHVINEDWTDAYADGMPEAYAAEESYGTDEPFRTDDESYNYFDAR